LQQGAETYCFLKILQNGKNMAKESKGVVQNYVARNPNSLWIKFKGRLTIGDGELHDAVIGKAINNKKPDAMERLQNTSKLIKKGANVNEYYAGSCSLKASLDICDNQKITPLLLESGADPNADYDLIEYGGTKGKTIQPSVDIGNMNNVKLLAFYGASPEGVNFKQWPSLEEVVKKYFTAFEKRAKLEAALKNEQDKQKKSAICEQLSLCWLQPAEGEEVVCRNHYQSKADYYEKLQKNYGV
jgi:thiol-disulfide isomerase/thioredoxin